MCVVITQVYQDTAVETQTVSQSNSIPRFSSSSVSFGSGLVVACSEVMHAAQDSALLQSEHYRSQQCY